MRVSRCYNAKNLDFFADFIRSVSDSIAGFAERAGMSKQLLGHYFRLDDIKLSKLRFILGNVGYQVEFTYSLKNAPKKNWSFEFLSSDEPVVDDGDRNIAFVIDAIRQLNISYPEFADKIGVKYASVVYWLVTAKDMDVSVVKRIAEKCDLDLSIRIFPKEHAI